MILPLADGVGEDYEHSSFPERYKVTIPSEWLVVYTLVGYEAIVEMVFELCHVGRDIDFI